MRDQFGEVPHPVDDAPVARTQVKKPSLRKKLEQARGYENICFCRYGRVRGTKPGQNCKNNCRECPGCEQRIKGKKLREHARTCVALQQAKDRMTSTKSGEEICLCGCHDVVTHWVHAVGSCCYPCIHCGERVKSGLMEWHWRNSCKNWSEQHAGKN